MTFYELLIHTSFDSIWKQLSKIIRGNMIIPVSDEKMDELERDYDRVYNNLINRNVTKNTNDNQIVVIKYLRSANGKHEEYRFESFMLDERIDFTAKQGILFDSWDYVLSLSVCGKSIDDYGRPACAASIMYDLTLLGIFTTLSANHMVFFKSSC